MYTPYPFANAAGSDFIADETFEFERSSSPGKYRCKVETSFFDAPAFAMISLEQDGEAWYLSCEIDGPVEKGARSVTPVRRVRLL